MTVNVVTALRHEASFFVLCLLVIAALLIKDAPRPVTTEDKATVAKAEKVPVANEEKAPVAKQDTQGDASPQAVGSVGKPGLTPNCEKELRRTADLLRFFANRIHGGEDTQSVVADMRQQEKKISAVCD
jgi:hypothetical protein